MEKKCFRCKEIKDVSNFHKHSNSKDGLCHCCKQCRKIEAKLYYENNKDKLKLYYQNNKDKLNSYHMEYRKKNEEKFKIERKKYYNKNKLAYKQRSKTNYDKDKIIKQEAKQSLDINDIWEKLKNEN